MTAVVIAFLALELLALVTCAIYVRLPTPGATKRHEAPVVVVPSLPRAICIPTAHRRAHKDIWP